MGLLSELLYFPLQLVANLWVSLLLVRAWAYATQSSMRHPVGEFMMRLTDFAVLPVRKFLKPSARIDWACVALGFAATLAFVLVSGVLFGGFSIGLFSGRTSMWAAVVLFARWSVYVLVAVLIVQAVLSWTQTNPHAAQFTQQLTDPLLTPIRRVMPNFGPVDLSPLVLIVAANMLLIIIGHLA